MTDQKITFNYLLAIIVGVLFTWVLHEFLHWFTAELMGYESVLRLNSVYPVNKDEQPDWDKIYISAAGPVVTILQALVVFLILKKNRWNKLIYPLLFIPFYMRALAGIINFLNPNDEGRISQFLGLGLYTISIAVSGILLFLVYKISKKYKLNWKFHLWTTLLVLVFSTLLIMLDQLFKIRIL